MANNREDRNTRRVNRDAEHSAQQMNQQYYQQGQNGQQYYQQNPYGQQQYYQQNPYGQQQYYQQNPGGQQAGQQTSGGQQVNQQNPYGQQQYYQQNPYGRQMNQQNPYGQQQYYRQDPNGGQYYRQNTRAAGTPPKKKKKKGRAVLFIFELLLLILLAVGLYVAATFSKLDRVELKEAEQIKQEVQQQLPEFTAQKLEGYWNIALYGVDSRTASSQGQSDTIIVCSINKDTKEVKLASVYRDSYLDAGGYSFRKATDVYAIYGPEGSISMLNRNLDLDITDYLTVNMNVIADVVNDLGGIEIDVREDEISILNGYQNEGSEITGLDIVPVVSAGPQILNGLQAMSYCRIRYTEAIDSVHEGLDYERTLRQRVVLEKILEKVKKLDPLTLTSMINSMIGNVSTSLSMTEILSLAKDITSYELVETTGFPFQKTTGDTDAGDCVIPVNLAENVKELHAFLFANNDYTASEIVQGISNEISYRTGVN